MNAICSTQTAIEITKARSRLVEWEYFALVLISFHEEIEEATGVIYRDATVDNGFHITGFLIGKESLGFVIS